MAISQPTYPVTTSDLVTHVGTYADTKAPAANPTLTGTVTVPTPAAGSTAAVAATAAFVNLTTISTKTADYTLALTDAGLLLVMNSASARVFTIPPNASVAFPVGTWVEFMRYGAGTLTITPGAGVTIPNSVQVAGTASRTIASQMTSAVAVKIATNEWWLSGSIA